MKKGIEGKPLTKQKHGVVVINRGEEKKTGYEN